MLAQHLRGFLGFEHDKIGAAVIYLRMGYRNGAGIIERDQFVDFAGATDYCSSIFHRFTIRLDDKVLPYNDFEGGPPESEIDRWARYLELALRTCNAYLLSPCN